MSAFIEAVFGGFHKNTKKRKGISIRISKTKVRKFEVILKDYAGGEKSTHRVNLVLKNFESQY
jgi:hypothetical protein